MLLLFFSPADLAGRSAAWAQLRRFHHDFGESRLLMLGILSGTPADAERVITQYTLRFPIGVGTSFREHFHVPDGPHQLLLDRSGKIHWSGALGALGESVLLKGMQKAKKLTEEETLLQLFVERELDGQPGRIAGRLAEGRLKRAIQDVEKLLASARTEGEVREDALYLQGRIERHVAAVLAQIEADVARGEALRVDRTLGALVRELKSVPAGAAAKKRLEELEDDADFQRELAADEEFEHVYAEFWRRGLTKVKTMLGRIVDDYPGTRAADKARTLMQIR